MRQSMVAAACDPCCGYLVVSGFTGFCPMQKFLRKKLGEKENDHDEIDD
jgi:hypothetical protein